MRKLRHEGHRGADKNMDDALDISKSFKKGTTRVENKEYETGTYTGTGWTAHRMERANTPFLMAMFTKATLWEE